MSWKCFLLRFVSKYSTFFHTFTTSTQFVQTLEFNGSDTIINDYISYYFLINIYRVKSRKDSHEKRTDPIFREKVFAHEHTTTEHGLPFLAS